jgi:RNA polymerase sigma-70 factor (ECF subfamily)
MNAPVLLVEPSASRRVGAATAAASMTLSSKPVGVDGAALSACIVSIAERGDREAFASLFSHFAPRVKSYLMRLGAPQEAAEELAQETLLTVWRRAAAFDPDRAAASTWIFTIARNLRIDLSRREARVTSPDDPSQYDPGPAAPDEALSAVEDEGRIGRALATLPREQAQVITLAFFADKPHSEIAKDLGLPLGTVKSRLRLAMGRLRGALAESRP